MESIATRIYTTVKERIVDGSYPLGSRITEQSLAAEFKTSRTPAREAMRLLVADGFALFKPNSGTLVREWTREQIRQLFDARVLIESEIAAEAAKRITPDQLAELTRLQGEIEASAATLQAGETTHVGRLNKQFHHLLAQASGNERLVDMLARAMEMPIVQQTFRRYTPGQLQRSFSHHRELLDALSVRDESWARNVMSCHIHAAKHARLADSGLA